MTLRIDVAERSLASLDALAADSLAVWVGPERPLRGLASLVDWRMCGALSRAIRTGQFTPEAGEALLLPAAGRLPVGRVFCFGVTAAVLDSVRFGEAARRVAGDMARAGSRAFATSLPPCRDGPIPAARLWLEASLGRPDIRQLLLGDPRALARELAIAAQAIGASIDVVVAGPPPVPPPVRSAGLPVRDAVLR
jgi:hypothetical protein